MRNYKVLWYNRNKKCGGYCMNILITGGTVFVGRYAAEYFISKGHRVYILNRNTRPQPIGAIPIIADRNALGDELKNIYFDAVIDTAYNADQVNGLLDALNGFDKYILISSSAVYPETLSQPFGEDSAVGKNSIWGDYGLNKIFAERALTARVKNAYILRPPYIYGEYNNIYREAFVFDCADRNLPFYIPKNSGMKLQFVHIADVCAFAEKLLLAAPPRKIYNLGTEPVEIEQWVKSCYAVAGRSAQLIEVSEDIEQRKYFPFYAYEYVLDTSEQDKLRRPTVTLADGLRRAYSAYKQGGYDVDKKDYLLFIENNLKNSGFRA